MAKGRDLRGFLGIDVDVDEGSYKEGQGKGAPYRKTPKELEPQFWHDLVKPRRIWSDLSSILKEYGFTWSKYLQLLRLMRREIILYELGELSYTLFLGLVAENARGPIGRYILELRKAGTDG